MMITFNKVIRLSATAVARGVARHRTEFARGAALARAMSYGNALVDGERSVGGVVSARAYAAAASPSVYVAIAVQPVTGNALARGNATVGGAFNLRGRATAQAFAQGIANDVTVALPGLEGYAADDAGYAVAEGPFRPLAGNAESDVDGEPTYNMAEGVFAFLTLSAYGVTGQLIETSVEFAPPGGLAANYRYSEADQELQSLEGVSYETFIDLTQNVLEQPTTELTASGGADGPQGGVFEQPASVIEMTRGWLIPVLPQPASELEVEGTLPLWGRALLEQSRTLLVAAGEVHATGGGVLEQPRSFIEAYGAGRAAFEQPRSELVAEGTTHPVGRGVLEQPGTHLIALGYTEVRGTGVFEQPASSLVDTGLVVLVQPQLVMAASGSVEVRAPTYGAYAINLSHGGFTRYTDFPVQQIVEFRGEYYGIGPSGLFRLEDGLGDEEQVGVVLQSGYTDFGSPAMKRVTHAYVVSNTMENLKLAALTGDGHPAQARFAGKSRREGTHTMRAQFGRGVKASTWGIRLEYVGQERLRIYSLELLVDELSRRVG